ncbi:hypothetical protein EDC04DRAFT_2589715, partial [Pisolithus marmoratus]
ALLSDPALVGHIEFCPCKIFNSAEKIHWVYHDWLTGDHAWELQSLLPPGAMLLGVILSSDKMHMTTFGNHQAHPLLISLANISRNARNKVLNHAYLLLALMQLC